MNLLRCKLLKLVSALNVAVKHAERPIAPYTCARAHKKLDQTADVTNLTHTQYIAQSCTPTLSPGRCPR